MNEVVTVGKNELQVKMWNGQRVVTFVDIDRVHERVEGTAKRNFADNKTHLIENEDYFLVKPSDIQKYEKRTLGFEVPNRGLTLFTEGGYLLLVKSFTDDLAWTVQRQLVNTYFKFKEVVQNFNTNYPIDTNALNGFLANLPCLFAQINNIEGNSERQNEKLDSVVDNMTLSVNAKFV